MGWDTCFDSRAELDGAFNEHRRNGERERSCCGCRADIALLTLPRDEPPRVGDGLDPLADPLRWLDENSRRAAHVAEPVDVLVALQRTNEFSAAGSQAGNDAVDVLDGE